MPDVYVVESYSGSDKKGVLTQNLDKALKEHWPGKDFRFLEKRWPSSEDIGRESVAFVTDGIAPEGGRDLSCAFVTTVEACQGPTLTVLFSPKRTVEVKCATLRHTGQNRVQFVNSQGDDPLKTVCLALVSFFEEDCCP